MVCLASGGDNRAMEEGTCVIGGFHSDDFHCSDTFSAFLLFPFSFFLLPFPAFAEDRLEALSYSNPLDPMPNASLLWARVVRHISCSHNLKACFPMTLEL